jgi:hypothetical protein
VVDQLIPKTSQNSLVRNAKGEKQNVKEEFSTSKALANFPARSGRSTSVVSIIFLVFRERVLLGTPFLLSVDKGRLSETGLVLGPCMIEEIEGALWPM